MLVFSFVRYDPATVPMSEHFNRGLYGILILTSFIYLLLLEYFFKNKKTGSYFTVVGCFLLTLMLWGVGTSLLDSYIGKIDNLTYFAITLIATSAFLTLEPWVASFACLLSAVIFDIIYFCVPVFESELLGN